MKLPSYREALKMSKEAVQETLIPLREAKVKKQAELAMAQIDEELAVLEQRITEACMQPEISFSTIISLHDSLALKQRTKRQYQEILDQMFPASTAC